MTSLIDLGPLSKNVPMRGTEFRVVGVSAKTIFTLLQDIPELRLVIAGKKLDSEVISALIDSGGRVLAQVIAAGLGAMGDEPTIKAAEDNLAAGESAELLEAIVELTFPQGIKSFVDRLVAANQSASVGGSGKAAATKSAVASTSASATATPQTSLGDTPPAS